MKTASILAWIILSNFVFIPIVAKSYFTLPSMNKQIFTNDTIQEAPKPHQYTPLQIPLPTLGWTGGNAAQFTDPRMVAMLGQSMSNAVYLGVEAGAEALFPKERLGLWNSLIQGFSGLGLMIVVNYRHNFFNSNLVCMIPTKETFLRFLD